MKLNREQIIKALEWCSDLRLCVDCPMRAEGYFSHSGNACRQALMKNALSLIKELTEENERLAKAKYIFATVDYCSDDLAKALDENKMLTEENERLENALIEQSAENVMLCGEVKHARADTVRKMQERLKEHLEKPEFPWDSFTVAEEVIDQIAKEMLEEDKNND